MASSQSQMTLFHLLPCTGKTRPLSIDDPDPEASWAKLGEPSPENWNWGTRVRGIDQAELDKDPYAGRGIYLCGYLDVPMDYTNKSDLRISRQAIIKYQVSGLKRLDGGSRPSAGQRVYARSSWSPVVLGEVDRA